MVESLSKSRFFGDGNGGDQVILFEVQGVPVKMTCLARMISPELTMTCTPLASWSMLVTGVDKRTEAPSSAAIFSAGACVPPIANALHYLSSQGRHNRKKGVVSWLPVIQAEYHPTYKVSCPLMFQVAIHPSLHGHVIKLVTICRKCFVKSSHLR